MAVVIRRARPLPRPAAPIAAIVAALVGACAPAARTPTIPPPPSATPPPTISPTPSETPTPTITPSPTFPADAVVVADALNVRGGPDTLHPVLASVGAGTPVAIRARDDASAWYSVRSPAGDEGWVSAQYLVLRREPGTIPTAPTPTPPPTPTPTPPPMDPSLPIVLSPSAIAQGDPLLVRLRAPGARQVIAALGELSNSLLPAGEDAFVGILAAPIDLPPGEHLVHVTYVDADGGVATRSVAIPVLDAGFSDEALTIPIESAPELAASIDPAVRAAEATRLAQAFTAVTEPRLWGPRWTPPLTPTVSSSFGGRRTYNDGLLAGRHSGVDFRARSGTPVVAPERGRVVMAEFLHVLGNSVWLDHGGGLYSGYGHLSEFAVAVGQEVQRGQVIGLVGATGSATGPHLHWEVRVRGVPTQGQQWLLRDVGIAP